MPLFGEATSPYDEAVEKVTAETLTTENWALMMDISDRVSSQGSKGCKQCVLSIKKRLNHRDPHVVLFALSLLDCIWNNSNTIFRREISSNDFIHELSYRATSSNRLIAEKTRELIKKWAENECKKDPALSLIDSLYRDLLTEGYNFESSEPVKTKKVMFSKDPNVVSSQQEEDDIAKAIALSLNDQKDSQPQRQSSNPYAIDLKEALQTPKEAPIRKVKALYDFEAAEDNELSFQMGDLINVFDASDANWWKGELAKGSKSGLFPSSFVTLDLSEEPQRVVVQPEPEVKQAQIDEEVLKRCIDLFEQCDPTGTVPDHPELVYFEQMSIAQAPLIDQKLAQIDKQTNMLAGVDVAIRDVLAQYDNIVQQTSYQVPPPQQYNPVQPSNYQYDPSQQYSLPPSQPPQEYRQ